MLTHVVLLKFQPGTDRFRLDSLADSLRALPSQIPEIRDYTVGVDIGLADGNAEVAVIARFDDAEGHAIYTNHPAHRKVIEEQILPVLASRNATQFES